ncbi:DUF3152 domain-containing protein [Streptomyces sp. NPDC004539]|uniref:DUF3152 domain-containing protein n=1 Tax=Streptomyces sp. NPDC004539 TaxID=3154280 RepID=UPI0033B47DE7
MGRHSRRGPAPKPAKKGAVPSQGAGSSGGASGGGASSGSASGGGGFTGGAGSGGVPGGGERPPLPSRNTEASWYESGSPSTGPYRGNGAPYGGAVPGTPPHGFPQLDGTPAYGFPSVRGGHPEQHEAGGGWGAFGESGGRPPVVPRPRAGGVPGGPGGSGGPRQEYLDAFGESAARMDSAGRMDTAVHMDVDLIDQLDRRDGVDRGIDHPSTSIKSVQPVNPGDHDDQVDPETPARQKNTKGRAFTGIAAAAVTTVLAVVVAGQVTTDDRGDDTSRTQAQGERSAEANTEAGTAGGVLPSPSVPADVKPLSYDDRMSVKYPLAADFKGSGKFDAVPGVDKAPGKGRKYTYRVDVEQGIGLDGGLFAQAVQKTLNDNRSWAHNGARTFERIFSGTPDFVITLASPGTTAFWCDKSGLDTTQDNVSCDSAATPRVMINAYRWAQGSKTYGDKMYAYRQMLINHEVGHRLGYGHVTCDKNGELAPVMQQQTKFLDHQGIHCLPNPWAYPAS